MMDAGTRAIVAAAARRDAFDSYLAALLAPRAVRDDLLLLAAFDGDVTRIATGHVEPMLREIRRQWWRDALEAISRGERSGNPVADGLAEMIGSGRIPLSSFIGSVDGWSELAAAAAGNVSPDAFDRFLDATYAAALMRGFTIAVGRPPEAGVADLVASAGQAIGIAAILADVPRQTREGCVMLPSPTDAAVRYLGLRASGQIAAVRAVWRQFPGPARAVLSPIALVGPYLDALQGRGPSESEPRHAMTPIGRVTRLWWAARIGRF